MNPEETAQREATAAAQPVTVQTFAEYLDQQRRLQEAAQESERKDRAESLEVQRAAVREQQEQQATSDQIRRVSDCDGACPNLLREWLKEVELTVPYTRRTVYVAAQRAQGILRREIERFLGPAERRENATWEALKDHIEQAFLPPQDDNTARHELESIQQGVYENCTSYARRFRELADLAYPARIRQVDGSLARYADQDRWILRSYLLGLRNKKFVERLVVEERVTSYEDAIGRVAAFERTQRLKRQAVEEGLIPERSEEPMEIDALNTRGVTTEAKKTPENPMAKDVQELQRKVDGLTEQFTKLMATLRKEQPPENHRQPRDTRQAPRTRPLPEHRFLENGTPICNYCGIEGHIARLCRKRRNHRQQAGRQDNQGGY